MPFENKDTLQKLHVKNTPPEKEKCGTHKNQDLTKNDKNAQGLFAQSWTAVFLKESL